MTCSFLDRATRTVTLALVLIEGLPNISLQGCSAAVVETSVIPTSEAIPEETTPSSINPWPTDTTYTYSSQNECIIVTGVPSGDCLLSVTVTNSEPGFVTNYCGAKNFTTTETRTPTVDCGGCDNLAVTVRRGGCPMGGSHPPTHTPQPTPYYHYEWACASTSESSSPTVSACPAREI